MLEHVKAYQFCNPCKYAYKRKWDKDNLYCSAPKGFCPYKNEIESTEWIISIDDDSKDYEEIFIGNVRAGDRLIRCKDCIHYDGHYCHNKWWGDGYGNYTSPIKADDGFCDWAERRDEE